MCEERVGKEDDGGSGFGRLSNGRREEAGCGQRPGQHGTGARWTMALSAPLIGREEDKVELEDKPRWTVRSFHGPMQHVHSGVPPEATRPSR